MFTARSPCILHASSRTVRVRLDPHLCDRVRYFPDAAAAGLQTGEVERPAARTVTRLARGARRGSGRTERRTRRRGIRAHRFDRERRRRIGRGCDSRARTGRLRIAGNEENRQLSRWPNPRRHGRTGGVDHGGDGDAGCVEPGGCQAIRGTRPRAREASGRARRPRRRVSERVSSVARRNIRLEAHRCERPRAPSPDPAPPSPSRIPQQLSALNLTHLEVRSARVSAISPRSHSRRRVPSRVSPTSPKSLRI